MADLRRACAALGLCAACALGAGPARARAEAEVRYTQKQTFSAALRYLRVDLAYEVTEKDPDAAYLLFQLKPDDKRGAATRGSIEVVQRDDSVRVFVSLPRLPGYREDVLKRGLLAKLRDEYGEPPPAKPPPSDAPSGREPEAESAQRPTGR